MSGKWTPGPWRACNEGECSCGQVWSTTADHPVSFVISGNWGDDYPAVRLQVIDGIGTKYEAFMVQNTYGSVDPEVAKANRRLIAAAPELYEALEEAKLQIEYLHEKFQGTGSGVSVLLHIESALRKARGEQP